MTDVMNDEKPVELDAAPLAPALREATNEELVQQLAERARAEGLQLTGDGEAIDGLTQGRGLQGPSQIRQLGSHIAAGRHGGHHATGPSRPSAVS